MSAEIFILSLSDCYSEQAPPRLENSYHSALTTTPSTAVPLNFLYGIIFFQVQWCCLTHGQQICLLAKINQQFTHSCKFCFHWRVNPVSHTAVNILLLSASSDDAQTPAELKGDLDPAVCFSWVWRTGLGLLIPAAGITLLIFKGTHHGIPTASTECTGQTTSS